MLRLAGQHLHRPVPPPDRRPDQHAECPDATGPLGGYEAFAAYGNAERTFAVRLQEAGYTTGFVGKYLNQYKYVPGGPVPAPPPGWSEFNVLFASAYDGWGF